MSKIKRVPYGIADFEAVNAENRYYADKAMYIPLPEETNYVFLKIDPLVLGKVYFYRL